MSEYGSVVEQNWKEKTVELEEILVAVVIHHKSNMGRPESEHRDPRRPTAWHLARLALTARNGIYED